MALLTIVVALKLDAILRRLYMINSSFERKIQYPRDIQLPGKIDTEDFTQSVVSSVFFN